MSTRENRKTPDRTIDEYVLTYEHGKQIVLSDTTENLQHLSYTDFTDLDSFNSVSSPQKLGFTFRLNQTNYEEIVIAPNGYLVLLDPNRTANFQITHVFYDDVIENETPADSDKNALIRTDGFLSGSHALIAPWMSYQHLLRSQITDVVATGFDTELENGMIATSVPHDTSIQYSKNKSEIRFNLNTTINGQQAAVVKWYCLSGLGRISNFEVILYANNKIEFNYEKSLLSRAPITQAENFNLAQFNRTDAAVIGVFVSGSNVFRDFSSEIYRVQPTDPTPIEHRFGGYTSTTTSSYIVDGKSAYQIVPNTLFWPIGTEGHGRFSFFPLAKQRKILPKIQLNKNDINKTYDSVFNDRKSQQFVTSSSPKATSFPTKQQRKSFDTIPGFAATQDLFTNEIQASGSHTPGYTDFFEELQLTSAPYKDVAIDDDAFKSKERISIEFSIDKPVKMLALTSSIYYFNKSFGAWLMPQNSLTLESPYDENSTYVPPHASNQELVKNPNFFLKNNIMTEDVKGFNALGMLVASGSGAVGPLQQGTAYLNTFPTSRSLAVETFYENTILNNRHYSPTQDEIIKIKNLKGPFLLENAVITIPFELGPGWFKDFTAPFRTFDFFTKNFDANVSTTTSLTNDDKFDLGGPAITVSLFNKVSRDIEGDQQKIDLILSSTLTHTFDNKKYFEVSASTPSRHNGYIRHIGFPSFHATPGAVVTPQKSSSLGYAYTGSVSFNCNAAIQNGVLIASYSDIKTNGTLSSINTTQLQSLISDKIQVLNKDNLIQGVISPFTGGLYHKQRILAIKALGRAATGMQPSGRSLQNEHKAITVENNLVDNPLKFPNAKTNSDLPSSWRNPTGSSPLPTYDSFMSVFPLTSSANSPYLLLPGDELFIAISKTRPCVYSTVGTVTSSIDECYPVFSSSNGHDVCLTTGSMKITLYGHYLQNGETLPSLLNRKNEDKVVYTVIGDDPVLDQIDATYKEQFYNTYSDGVITGSMVEVYNGQIYTGSRGKHLDAVNTKYKSSWELTNGNPFLSGMGGEGALAETIYAAAVSTWFETQASQCNRIQNNTVLYSTNEQYYDSYVPNIEKIWRINGAKTYVPPETGFGKFARISLNQRTPYLEDLSSSNKQIAVDNIWAESFPLEPRYSSVERNIKVLTTYKADIKETDVVDRVKSLNIVLGSYDPTQLSSSYEYYEYYPAYEIYQPVSQKQVNEFDKFLAHQYNKVLFGFGDFNTYAYSGSIRNGYSAWPSFKYIAGTQCHGPVIRGIKYGLTNISPTKTSAVFRRNHFGHFRDMLEQRVYTKFIIEEANNDKFQKTVSIVDVKFVNSATGLIVSPSETSAQNISTECSSSLPYFDDIARNR